MGSKDSGGSCATAIIGEGRNARQSAALAVAGHFCPPVCFAVMARDTWGAKAPTIIAGYLKRQDNDFRTERRWCSAQSDAPSQVLIDLLREAEGFILLSRLMRDDPPTWWINFMQLKACAEAYEQQRRITKQNGAMVGLNRGKDEVDNRRA